MRIPIETYIHIFIFIYYEHIICIMYTFYLIHYNVKKSFHLCEPVYLSALPRCTIISLHNWVQSIHNRGKFTRIQFPKSYHFKLYWTVALKTSCKLGIVDCPLRQLLSHIKIKLSSCSVPKQTHVSRSYASSNICKFRRLICLLRNSWFSLSNWTVV